MRILIAEDEQRTRQGLVRVLQSLRDEYEIVAQASNGKAALEMILEQKPDVVFIDIKMPFMDGLSVIEAARAQGIKAEFVIVSASASVIGFTRTFGPNIYSVSTFQLSLSSGKS